MGGFFDAVGKGLSDAGDWVEGGWNQLTTGHKDPGKELKKLGQVYDPDEAKFTVTENVPLQGVARDATAMADTGRDTRNTAVDTMLNGVDAPTVSKTAPVAAGNVVAQTGNSAGALGTAYGALTDAEQSRAAQGGAIDLVQQTAMGQGPSVAPDMIREAGAAATADYAFNANDALSAYNNTALNATNAYGNAAGDSALAYSDALAAQQFAAQQAAIQGGRATMRAGEDAVKRAAALTAGARGNNMAAAMLQGQNDAAMTMADANRTAGMTVSDAQMAASAQQAAAQRQAAANEAATGRQVAYNQAAANATTATQQGAANISVAEQQALADFRAGQVASGEMLDAQGRLVDATTAARAGDSQLVQDALGLGDLGMGIDQLLTGTAVGNADRDLAADTTSAGIASNEAITNAQLEADTNALNMGAAESAAALGSNEWLAGLGTAQDLGTMDFNAGMSLEDFAAQEREKALLRQMGFDSSTTGNRIDMFGAAAGGAATIGAAALASDERVKDIDEDDQGAPDFRKTRNARYRYKDPDKHGKGVFDGPMAQELPESVVAEDEDGVLRVDTGRLALLMSSAVGDLQKRLDNLEAA
jgi:hypothetical protein